MDRSRRWRRVWFASTVSVALLATTAWGVNLHFRFQGLTKPERRLAQTLLTSDPFCSKPWAVTKFDQFTHDRVTWSCKYFSLWGGWRIRDSSKSRGAWCADGWWRADMVDWTPWGTYYEEPMTGPVCVPSSDGLPIPPLPAGLDAM